METPERGTFVTLNDGSYGLVIESNSRNLLRPLLMLYDASVPRNAPQGRVDFYLEGAS